MFTRTENRKITATVFAWLSLGIGGVANLYVIATIVFWLLHGLNRHSELALALASDVAFGALVLGGAAGGYSLTLHGSRLAKLAVALSVLPLPVSILIGTAAGVHA